jgi:hypothetical protein
MSQATHSHTIHSEFKTISSYLFPLKSWPAPVLVNQNHINYRGRRCITLDTLQGLASPLWRISPRRLLTLTTQGLPTWSGHLAWISVSLHQSEGPVHSSAASFSHLEREPRITSGVHASWFQGPPQAAEPGSGDLLPNRARQYDLTVVGRMSDQQEKDSNPGGWRKGIFITLVGQHPGSLQN